MSVKNIIYTLSVACGGYFFLHHFANGMNRISEIVTPRPIIVELYTSQGCSSCPPADNVLKLLSHNPHILPLSFHVDYWNYIGWRDPFSDPRFTERQSRYNYLLRRSGNYTPQMVIEGVSETVGAYKGTVAGLVATHAKSLIHIPISTQRSTDGEVAVTIEQAYSQPANLVLIGYNSRQSTQILRGENAGATLENINVVTHYQIVARWGGQPKTITISRDNFGASEHYVLLLQELPQGRIIGAKPIN